MTPLFQCLNLRVGFRRYAGGLATRTMWPVDGLDVSVDGGEMVAVVGASGAGKTLMAHALLGILPANAVVEGSLLFRGQELTPERLTGLRGRTIALVPQSIAALDPLMRVGALVRRSTELAGHPRGEAESLAAAALMRHGLAPEVARLYPHQLSGGMARRVLIAAATVGGANMVIADEPTPGLDVPVAREVLGDLRRLADDGRAVLIITHDLWLALPFVDRVVVMQDGCTVDQAPRSAFTGDGEALGHEYTRALWVALPENGMQIHA